jgi:hypothetical protein
MHRFELLGPAGSGKSTLAARLQRAHHGHATFDSLVESKLRVLRVSSGLPAVAHRLLARAIRRAPHRKLTSYVLDGLLKRAREVAIEALKSAPFAPPAAPLTELTRACFDELARDPTLDPLRRLLRLRACLRIVEHLGLLRHWRIARPVLLEEGIVHKTPFGGAADSLSRGLLGVIALDLPPELHAEQLRGRIAANKERNVGLRRRGPDEVLSWTRAAATRNKAKLRRLRDAGVPMLVVTSHDEARDTDALLAFARGALRAHASSACCVGPDAPVARKSTSSSCRAS